MKLQDETLPIKCPGCNAPHNIALKDLAPGFTVTCKCGDKIVIKGPDIASSIKKLDKTLSRLGKVRKR